jgi:hypothetical protein
MSNIILNEDISENSSFASNLTRLSQLSKNKIVVPSKTSDLDNNDIQPVKPSGISNFTILPPKSTVLNSDTSENSSLVSNFTRLSQFSKKNTHPKSNVSESSSQSSLPRSLSTQESNTKSSFQQMSLSSNSYKNDDTEIASATHSENSTRISLYSSENSNKQSIHTPINNTPINNTPSVITNSINKTQPNIMNRVVIDVAVLCQEYTTIETMCHDNIINLDEILITKELFQSIFYPYHENFGLNKDFVNNNRDLSPHISFIPEFRSVNSKKFYLLEEIISNIERDLNISRNCFTKESLVELTNEIISIKSLCDINCCSVLASLSWQNILEIIKNYQLINYCQCEKSPESDENYCQMCKTTKSEIIPICVVNIIFKTPTPGVKNTIIRFNYRITNL